MRNLVAAAALSVLLVDVSVAGAADEITPELRSQTIATLAREFRANYVFPDKAGEASDAVLAKERAGGYAQVTGGAALAKILADDLNAVCRDAHLRMRYSSQALPERKRMERPTKEEERAQRESVLKTNAGFEKVERLAGNVGYLEVRGFMDPSLASAPARAAMDFLANTDALIIDLRRNGGGYPETVQLLCSYLFGSKRVHLNDLYFRKGNKTTEFWTLGSLPGKRYVDKPVYVLSSRRTGSGAEEFCYNLQNLKRAPIIGERTWGGANPGDVFRLNPHFEVFIPMGRAVSPVTKTNWEGTGVTPDVAVPAEQAMKTAHVMALKAILSQQTDAEAKSRLEQTIKAVADSEPPPAR